MSRSKITRRAVLRGAGAAVALPWMEAMASAADLAGSTPAGPRRMAFFYVPNGVHMKDWKPEGDGRDYTLPWILEPLNPLKDDTLVLTGLAQHNAKALGDGPGDHARSLSCFLTGVHPVKTDGANIKAGVSVDQVAAQQIGSATRLPSLELGVERGGQSGNCDSGYSCAYSSNISWRSPTTPTSKEINPRLVFDRLFGGRGKTGSEADRRKRSLYERSLLDFVLEDAQALRNRIGVNDRRKLDEYLTAVREVEQRIARADASDDKGFDVGSARPAGVPKDYAEHVRLMFDLIVLAFQTDSTRICTFMYANEGSSRPYPFLEIPEGHHDLSHHGNDPKKHEKIRKINRFHIEEFARMLQRLKETREGDRSILDNSMIVYGSGISDGDRHNHDDLPVLMVGKGGGTIETGRHVVYPSQPLNNLYLSMLDRMDVPCERLGDSTGRLERLA
ncbi:DUF1552 domain-containing protein [Planctomyces sp. SH-PL62]|uniref:DUF1552 domain-containing protein n=1 Tax=Planctomyces sp. SH-PL62 TaxID=1636152 RepID=UPI00078BCC61|nr:DUF1552 domain-containing protein [Planctomyces sp. SH-PL62]AMV39407.1 hypothetical protein VT85_18360 [Planctomyces sp. SH-PL62]